MPKLIELGATAFPTYRQMLDDPATKPLIAARILYTIQRVPGDRSEFLPYAIRGLTARRYTLAIGSINFIAEVGGAADAPLLLASVNHPQSEVRYAAANALSKIGTSKEAAWLTVWLERDGAGAGPDVRKAVSDAIAETRRKGG
ncbi:MAG: HEAT repeat domain-containing protein [Tepidisphaeraceae bacterium]